MKVIQEKLPASQLGLEIEITPEMSQDAYEKALRELTRNANIPGFRKGKIPRQVLIQRFGSSRIKAIALEDLVEESLKKAIEQEKIDAIGNFQLKSSFEDLVSQFQPGSALTFSAAVDVPPDVTLGQYQGLSVQAEESVYDPKQVDEVLESSRARAATLVPVEGRPAQEKDVAVVDFSGTIAGDGDDAGQEIPGGSAQDFEIELTEGRFIPGFMEGIWGMNPGETKEFEVTFPDDYAQEDLAGKPALFTVTLKELKEKELPELDDDFAQEVSEFETLAELRASLESQYQEQADKQTRSNKETALLEALLAEVEAELPETLIRQEVDFIVTQTAMQFSRQGMDIKRLFTEEVVRGFRERSRPEAILRIRRTLALGKIAELEAIKVDGAAVDTKVSEMLETLDRNEIDMQRLREVVEEDLLKEKIFDWLFEHNTIELVPEGTLKKPEDETSDDAANSDGDAEDEGEAAIATTTETVDVAAVEVAPALEPDLSPEPDTASPAPSADATVVDIAAASPEASSDDAEEEAPKAKSTKRKAKSSKGDEAGSDD